MYLKYCRTCDTEKTVSEFGNDKLKKDGLRSNCKECCRARAALNAEKTKDKIKERRKRHYEEHADRIKAYSREYYKKNPLPQIEWRKRNADKCRENCRKWGRENPEKVCEIQARKRTRKLLRTPGWLTEQHWEEIKTEYALAKWCTEVMGTPYHVDHIVPLKGKQVCGLHVPWNLRVIPALDNISKGNRFDVG